MRKSPSTNPELTEEEKILEQTLRPKFISEFDGQKSVTDNLNVFISAAKKRDEALDHVLLTGPPGLGKTTLAHIVANEMGVKLKITSGPVLEKPGDLAGILTNLEEKSVLFIDEIHRLSPVIEEYLYSAMEDYKLDIMIDSGPNARSVQISLPKYTLVGATTRAGMLSSPLRDRFGIKFRLDYYDAETLEKIVRRSSSILKLKINNDASYEIAKRSRGTPRIANRLLRRTRDFADYEDKKAIDLEVSRKALKALEVDEFVPLNIQKAFANGTRSKDGNPGENYWQNSADYKIKIKFSPYNKFIDGTETIKYYNNSQDTLSELVIRLYQNFYKSNSARNFQISSESVTDGIELKRLIINNESIVLDDNSSLNFTNTNLIIKLSEMIKPISSVSIAVDWNFTIPAGSPIRMGVYDSTSFLIAYWYPQIAVYDDIDGWDKIDFNGEQEMYNDFNNYDVEIEVPDKFVVWSTGVLQNAKEVLSESTFKKFEMAHASDTVINIITNDDYISANNFLSGRKTNVWHFKADNVTDFAFGISDHYLW